MFAKLAKYLKTFGHGTELQKFIVRTKIKEKSVKKLLLPLIAVVMFCGVAKVSAPGGHQAVNLNATTATTTEVVGGMTDADVARYYEFTEEEFAGLSLERRVRCRRRMERRVERLNAELSVVERAEATARGFREQGMLQALAGGTAYADEVVEIGSEDVEFLKKVRAELARDLEEIKLAYGVLTRLVKTRLLALQAIEGKLRFLLQDVNAKLGDLADDTEEEVLRYAALACSPDLSPAEKEAVRDDKGATFAAAIAAAGGEEAFWRKQAEYQEEERRKKIAGLRDFIKSVKTDILSLVTRQKDVHEEYSLYKKDEENVWFTTKCVGGAFVAGFLVGVGGLFAFRACPVAKKVAEEGAKQVVSCACP
jgi:hypothetical protein